MKVAFISNYFNHHQAPFCNEMYRLLGDSFIFIETETMEEERAHMGWGITKYPSYVKKAYSSSDEEDKCLRLIDEADAVIFGSAPERFIKNRLRNNKLIIRYSERPLENGIEPFKYPYRWLKWHIRVPYNSKTFMLCASAYTSLDFKLLGILKNRFYKWGYFPPTRTYTNIDDVIKNKKKNSLLWVSRLIPLKHPEKVLELAKKLKEEGYCYILSLIGTGPLHDYVISYIIENDLEEYVKVYDSMTPDEVRDKMEETEIFVFTSDYHEGWGAVLNESMNSGCAVVTNREIGSVPFLIKDGINGLLYKHDEIDSIFKCVSSLLDNNEKRIKISREAYNTIVSDWNAEEAAQRLLRLIEDLKNKGVSERYLFGPCSKA